MTEFELIARLTRSLPTGAGVIAGAGDDCAVIDLGLPGSWLLFKTDAVVEGVHFETSTPPEKVGRKALARCLSDVAAMAGTPTHALVTLALPSGFDADYVERLYRGLGELASRHGVAVVGGETTSSPGGILVSVALIGTVARGKAILRSGALAGDAIFVTGELGGSIAGKHLDFEPRLAEARWLVEHFALHAMVDVSDGLASDLRHILARSNVGAELLAASIPVSRAAKVRALASSSAPPPLAAVLADGEDFELLFTLASCDAVRLLDTWKAQFPSVKLTCIGKVTAETGLRLRDARGVHDLAARGYEHFAPHQNGGAPRE